jgi:AbiV family abortive infection protein
MKAQDTSNFNKIYQNGASHIEAAKILANNRYFGFALAHIVLGIEELIKYQIVVYYYCHDSPFDKSDKDNVFSKHKKKHELLAEFQRAISESFTEDFLEAVFLDMSGKELERKHIDAKQNRFNRIGSFLSLSYKEINLTQQERNSFQNWILQADEFKKKGFYVDELRGAFKSPDEIGQEQLVEGLKYADTILKQTEVIKSLHVTDEEWEKMFPEIFGAGQDFTIPDDWWGNYFTNADKLLNPKTM